MLFDSDIFSSFSFHDQCEGCTGILCLVCVLLISVLSFADFHLCFLQYAAFRGRSRILTYGGRKVAVRTGEWAVLFASNLFLMLCRYNVTRRNAITRAAMQNLDNQIWKSRISLHTKLKLYNTCILPIFLYGSECWAVTKNDVRKIDALDQWCLRMLLGISWHQHVRNEKSGG